MKSRKVACITAMMVFAALAIPVRLPAQVTGSGTTNHVPIWTNSDTLGSSNVVQSGGKVGIGTSSPAASLDVRGPNAPIATPALTVFQVVGGKGGPASVVFPGSSFPGGQGGGMQFTAGGGGGFCYQFVNGACVSSANGGGGGSMQIGGGFGVNLRLAGDRFGGAGGSITLQPGHGGSVEGSDIFPGAPGNVILAPAGGKVGIGETNPAHTLEITVGGTTLADEWITRSSRRFKTNIQPLEGALQKVEQLQGVSYDRNADGKHQIGVIAEDVDRIVPEVVSRDPNTNEVQGVDYSRLAALLIEAVKSQQTEIQLLKAEIEQLRPNSSGR